MLDPEWSVPAFAWIVRARGRTNAKKKLTSRLLHYRNIWTPSISFNSDNVACNNATELGYLGMTWGKGYVSRCCQPKQLHTLLQSTNRMSQEFHRTVPSISSTTEVAAPYRTTRSSTGRAETTGRAALRLFHLGPLFHMHEAAGQRGHLRLHLRGRCSLRARCSPRWSVLFREEGGIWGGEGRVGEYLNEASLLGFFWILLVSCY